MLQILNDFNDDFDILTDKQREFLASDRESVLAENFDYLNLKMSKNEDYTFPNSFILQWSPKSQAKVIISESKEFSNPIEFFGYGECEISNLKSDTTYFVQVVKDEKNKSEVRQFKTKNSPFRFIKVDGITNVRDSGGRKTKDGNRVKQGLLYRGSEMNSHITISGQGLKTMRDVLKIKTVIDLRRDTEIVEDVYKGEYVNIPAYAYVDIFEKSQSIHDVFRLFAKVENYPIYYHCWGGADRTGTIAFLLGALLGEEEKSLLDDYELTSLSIWGVRSRNLQVFKNFIEQLNSYDGEDLSKKVENYLMSVGVTSQEIKSIKAINLERIG